VEISPEVLRKSVESLLKLQEIDAKLFQYRQESSVVPEEMVKAQSDLLEISKVVKSLDRGFKDVDRERRALELRSLTLAEDLKRAEAKRRDLRNTKEEFSANKEVDNFQKRVAETKKLLEEKTEISKQKTEARDAKQKENDELQTKVKQLEEARAKGLSDITSKIEELLKQRDQFISQVDDQVFSLYERVQKIRKGSGVALVKDSICTGCFVSLPPQTRMQLEKLTALITCPSCSRILFPQNELSGGLTSNNAIVADSIKAASV